MCVVVIRTAMLMFQRTRKTTDRLELWRMGNFETFGYRQHRALREIWTQGYMNKTAHIIGLSGKLALPEKETHVAMFSTYRCRETIRLANELLEERKEMEKRNKRKAERRNKIA